MSLLDTLKDMAVNSVKDKLFSSSSIGGYAKVAEQLLSSNSKSGVGGLVGLVSLFDKAGLGNIISSWIGNASNLPISSDQLKSVLGSGLVSSLASSVGTDESNLLGNLTKFLPAVIDQVTPDGKIPEGDITKNLDFGKLIGGLLK